MFLGSLYHSEGSAFDVSHQIWAIEPNLISHIGTYLRIFYIYMCNHIFWDFLHFLDIFRPFSRILHTCCTYFVNLENIKKFPKSLGNFAKYFDEDTWLWKYYGCWAAWILVVPHHWRSKHLKYPTCRLQLLAKFIRNSWKLLNLTVK